MSLISPVCSGLTTENNLEPEDTLQLTLEADTEEQREFYQMVGDFLLQKKQKQVIARNLF